MRFALRDRSVADLARESLGVRRYGRPRPRRAGGYRLLLGASLLVATGLPGLGPADANETTGVRLELNRLETVGEACRAYLLIENASPEPYRSLRLDLFAFDTDGVVARRVALEAGPLAAKKTSVKLFDFAGLACERFSRVLLNDVIACDVGEGARPDCLSQVTTGSKVARVAFGK